MQPPNHVHSDSDPHSLNFCNSQVCRLPPDILGEIFQLSCNTAYGPSWSRPLSPLALSRVCSYWRNVAGFTPQIWRLLKLGGKVWASNHKIDMLSLFIHNSGGLGLDVQIYSKPNRDVKTGEHVIPGGDVFDVLFIHHPSKLEFIKFFHHIPEWTIHISAIAEAGRLTHLKGLEFGAVGHRNWNITPLPLSNVPHLRTVRLTDNRAVFKCPWFQIRRLSLSYFTCARALDIIMQCANVEFLECHNTFAAPLRKDSRPRRAVYLWLQHLRCTGAERLGTLWDTDFQYFKLPSLTTLIIDPVPRDRFPLSFPSTLTFLSLELEGRQYDMGILRNALSSLTNLEEFQLLFWAGTNSRLIELLIFHPISAGPDVATNCDSLQLLPQLTNLSITVSKSDKVGPPTYSDIFPPLLEAIRSRWKTSGCQTLAKFIFSHTDADHHFDHHFSALSPTSDSFISEIRSMVCDGLEVTLIWNNKDVTKEWLNLDD